MVKAVLLIAETPISPRRGPSGRECDLTVACSRFEDFIASADVLVEEEKNGEHDDRTDQGE